MHPLPIELAVSFGMVALLIVTHMLGLFTLVRITRLHLDHFRTPWLTLDRLLVPLTMGTSLFVLHGVEVWSYAVVYKLAHVMPTWEQAIYLSAGAYSTAGWNDVHVPDGWRVTAALESVAGMLLVGWSTAFLFQTLHRILATEDNHPLPEGAIAADASEDDNLSPRDSGSGSGAPSGTNSSETELMQ
jgi:hypothetical protein